MSFILMLDIPFLSINVVSYDYPKRSYILIYYDAFFVYNFSVQKYFIY